MLLHRFAQAMELLPDSKFGKLRHPGTRSDLELADLASTTIPERDSPRVLREGRSSACMD